MTKYGLDLNWFGQILLGLFGNKKCLTKPQSDPFRSRIMQEGARLYKAELEFNRSSKILIGPS